MLFYEYRGGIYEQRNDKGIDSVPSRYLLTAGYSQISHRRVQTVEARQQVIGHVASVQRIPDLHKVSSESGNVRVFLGEGPEFGLGLGIEELYLSEPVDRQVIEGHSHAVLI